MSETTPIDRDLAKQWPELARGTRTAAGQATPPGELLWALPVLLLYIGLMLGPWAAVFLALFLAKGNLGYRRLMLVVGVCGSVWCVSQGLSAYLGMSLDFLDLQMLRSALNFCAGMVTYIVVRPLVLERYDVRARTFVVSGALIITMIALNLLLPLRWMVFLGR